MYRKFPLTLPCEIVVVVVVACTQNKFTQDMQPHYIYSPREMTRWVRGICEALRPLETLSVEGLVRIWAHEAQRLFQDRSRLLRFFLDYSVFSAVESRRKLIATIADARCQHEYRSIVKHLISK